MCTEDSAGCAPVPPPADTYSAPPSRAVSAYGAEMDHTLAVVDLKGGVWPNNMVIGARMRTFPIPLQTRLSAGGSITRSDFRHELKNATFTSLGSERLAPRGRLPTGLGTASKWYFVQSNHNRIYAFHDGMWRSTAKDDANAWAAHLACGARDPQFLPSRMEDSGFVMNSQVHASVNGDAEVLPSRGKDWFYFDVI